jgi:di/tricarboxylate transporter
MTSDILIVLIILGASIVLFITEIIRMDVTALLILISLTLTGIITPEEAFRGFSDPAVIAVIGIFIMSEGLDYSGVADKMGSGFKKLGGTSETRMIIIVMFSVSIFSSVMNNIAATSILLPAVMSLSASSKIPPSKLLIPLAFGSSLGGMLTLIGTPPNLIVSSALSEADLTPFTLFDFTPAAAAIVIAGIAFMALYGRKLLPDIPYQQKLGRRSIAAELANLYKLHENLYETNIPAGNTLDGQRIIDSKLREAHNINVFAIVRGEIVIMQPAPDEKIRSQDRVLFTGKKEKLEEVVKALGLELKETQISSLINLSINETGLLEATLSPRSRLDGCTLKEAKFRDRYGVNVIGVWRKGEAITTGLGDVCLQLGDALLLQGPWRQFKVLKSEPDLIMLGDSGKQYKREKAPLAVIILLLALLPAVLGLLPIALSALAGGVLMILTRCLPVEQAYKNLQWSTIFMMVGILPLGNAINKTGTAAFIAENFLTHISDIGVFPLILVIFILTVLLCISTSNVAAAVIMAPIALVKSTALGIDPHILLLVVAYAASTSFITPIAHQSNILVMGIAGYKFNDYVKVGIPLTILTMLVTAGALLLLYY